MSVGVPHAPSDAKALGAGSLAFIVGRGRWGRVKPFGIIIRRLCKAQTKWLIPNSSEIRQHFFGLPYSLSMDGARRGIDTASLEERPNSPQEHCLAEKNVFAKIRRAYYLNPKSFGLMLAKPCNCLIFKLKTKNWSERAKKKATGKEDKSSFETLSDSTRRNANVIEFDAQMQVFKNIAQLLILA